MKKIILIITLLYLFINVHAYDIVPGVTLERYSNYKGEKQIINIAKVDLTRSDIHLGIGLGDKNKIVKDKPYGKEAVSQIVEKNHAVLGINADYFILESFRDNLNFCLYKGEIVSEPQYSRSVMFINKDNHIFFDVPTLTTTLFLQDGSSFNITGINRARNAGDTILFTDEFASTTLSKYAGYDVELKPVFNERTYPNRDIMYQVTKVLPNSINNPIEAGCVLLSTTTKSNPLITNLAIGDLVTIRYDLKAKEDTSDTIYATGGGPMLVQNGMVSISQEGFKNDITKGRNPRTAVGVNRDNTELILVTVDGRSSSSCGFTLKELGDFLKEQGAYNAMNLDGGGSTTMSVLGLVMNSPSGLTERYVANSLLVFSDYVGTPISPDIDYNNCVFRCENNYNFNQGELWGTFGGIGYFDKNNTFFTNSNEKKGKIGFIHDGMKYEYAIETSKATLSNSVIVVSFIDENEDTTTYFCTLKLYDSKNNPMSFSPIFIYSDTGSLNSTRFISDIKGEVNFTLKFATGEERNKSIRIVFDNFNKTFEF